MTRLAIREGLRNVRRHGALSVVLSGATGLVLLLGLLVLAIGEGVSARLAAWERRVEVVAFCAPDTTAAQVGDILDALLAMPGVSGVVYTSPEEGWRELIAGTRAAEDLISADELQLVPGAFTLHLQPGHTTPDALQAVVEQGRAVPGVVEVEYAADLLASYAAFRQEVARISLLTVFVVVLLLGGLTLATLRLGLGARRRELRAWAWEGAGPRFLTVVFATEAGVQGVLGGLAAWGVFAVGRLAAAARWDLSLAPSWHTPVLLLAVGPIICALASIVSTRRLLTSLGALLLVMGVLGGKPHSATAEAAVAPAPGTAAAFDAERMRGDLARLKQQHERARTEAERLSGETRSLLDALQELGRIEDALRSRINHLKAQDAELAVAVGALESEMAAAGDRHRVLGERAVRLSRLAQRMPPTGAVDVLLQDTPQGAMLRARKVRQVLLRHRLEIFGELERVQRDLRRQRNALQATGAERGKLADELEVEHRMQLAAKTERRAILQTAQSEQAVAAATIADLEAAMRELDRVLEALPVGGERGRSYYGPIPFPELRGVLPWPVEQGQLARRFGRRVAPVFLTVTQHDGWLLWAEAGKPVLTVHDGRVEYAGWLHGYGKLLVLDHGGGYRTLYGHLAGFVHSPGDVVRAGDVIGTVGTTGPLKRPAMYFAVRVHGTAQNPASWLAPNGG